MKINEFASAEDTLALWRVISDNTWAAVAQQAEAEAKQKAERAAARKSASKRGRALVAAVAAPEPRRRCSGEGCRRRFGGGLGQRQELGAGGAEGGDDVEEGWTGLDVVWVRWLRKVEQVSKFFFISFRRSAKEERSESFQEII